MFRRSLAALVFLMPSAVLFEINADANFDEICVHSKDKFPDLDGLKLCEEDYDGVLLCQFRNGDWRLLRANISCHEFMGNSPEQDFAIKLVPGDVSTRDWCEGLDGQSRCRRAPSLNLVE